MKDAKFTLEQLFYPEVSVQAHKGFDPESDMTPTEPEVVVHMHKTGPNVYHVGVKLVLNAEVPTDRYSIDVFGVGAFTGDETLLDDMRAALVAQSGPNIVYGGIRDMIATITGRGPWGEYFLQPKIIGPEDFAEVE